MRKEAPKVPAETARVRSPFRKLLWPQQGAGRERLKQHRAALDQERDGSDLAQGHSFQARQPIAEDVTFKALPI